MSNQRYLVTARKYRPQTFGELVAQEHVTETLKNAIRLDRLAHAYLFSGPRGVGKTTAARILAKAINCTTAPEARGDAAEPCRTCDSCRSFEEGRSLNIIEIDAASNNKVEDVRDLRETVRIPPQGSRKKVYIIDEVHMLSNAAFNALLKTLEEPPPHVLFIFATTEPHKVLATILSRCQRFDFRRIPVPEIVARLHEICAVEGITADEASLMLVARKGDGALRDALSAFDQAVSLCGTELVYAELAQALGVVDVDLFFEVTQHVEARSAAGMLRMVERIVRSGYDLQEFLVGLAEHLRNLLVARTMGETSLIEAAEAARQRYAEAALRHAEPDLLRLLALADEAEEAIKTSTQPRLKLEMALLKMASLRATADLQQALQKLDRLEAMARDGRLNLPAEAAGAGKSPRPAAPAPPPEPAPARTEVREPASPPAARPVPPPAPEAPDAPRVRPISPSRPAPVEDEAEAVPEAPVARPPVEPQRLPAPRPAPEPRPAAAPPPLTGSSLFGEPALKRRSSHGDDPGRNAPDNALLDASGDEGDTATVTAPIVSLSASPALRRIEARWPRFVQAVKRDRIHVGSLLQHASPAGVDDDTLFVAVPDDFHQRLLGSQHDFLLKHLQDALDSAPAQLQFILREEPAAETPAAAPADTFDPFVYMQRKRQENPVVRAIFDQFGGELVW